MSRQLLLESNVIVELELRVKLWDLSVESHSLRIKSDEKI